MRWSILALLLTACAAPERLCTLARDGGETVSGCRDGEFCAEASGAPCRYLGCSGTCTQGCLVDSDCGDAYSCNDGYCE